MPSITEDINSPAPQPGASEQRQGKLDVVLVDPVWEVGSMLFDGQPLPIVTLCHPQGKISCLVSKDSLAALIGMQTWIAVETMQ